MMLLTDGVNLMGFVTSPASVLFLCKRVFFYGLVSFLRLVADKMRKKELGFWIFCEASNELSLKNALTY